MIHEIDRVEVKLLMTTPEIGLSEIDRTDRLQTRLRQVDRQDDGQTQRYVEEADKPGRSHEL